ncbi:MAG: amidohydrolase family protein, partial [Planctomycetota bacterium]
KKEPPKEGEKRPPETPKPEPPKREEGKEPQKPPEFVPPKINETLRPLMELIEKKEGRFALIEIDSASDFVHVEDVLRDYDIAYGLWLENTHMSSSYRPGRDWNLAAEAIGKAKLPTVLKPVLNWESFTRIRYNLAKLLLDAGAQVAFQPPSESPTGFETTLIGLAEVVKAGLSRKQALEAVTVAPAKLLGVGERIGTIAEGRDADLVFLDGDPFDPLARVVRVMIEGHVVYEWKAADPQCGGAAPK